MANDVEHVVDSLQTINQNFEKNGDLYKKKIRRSSRAEEGTMIVDNIYITCSLFEFSGSGLVRA